MRSHQDGALPTSGEIFVFGSNLAGIHGAGAAKVAMKKFGAIWGNPVGPCGMSYAIPTKDIDIQTISLDRIRKYVDVFNTYAKENPSKVFWMTRIGCGLAGYKNNQIAPMFTKLYNVSYPEEWVDLLT